MCDVTYFDASFGPEAGLTCPEAGLSFPEAGLSGPEAGLSCPERPALSRGACVLLQPFSRGRAHAELQAWL